MNQNTHDIQSGGEILIIDDNPANLRLLFGILTKAGWRVRAGTSGAQGLDAVESRAPDLILMDIRMPEMDGFEVCRRLKARENAREIPIIFISALNDAVDKAEGFRLGAVDYITKPFETPEVIARVKTHLTIRETRTRLEEANGQLRTARDQLERLNADLEERVRRRTAELMNANRALRASEAKWRSLVENAPDVIFTTDREGTILFINRAPGGRTVEEFIGTL